MPARLSKSPRKGRTKANRYISSNPLPGSSSRRTTIRAATAYDTLASQKESFVARVLEELGFKKGKTPASLGELLRQSRNLSIRDVNDGFGDDGFGGFDGVEIDHDHESDWESVFMDSDDELEDDKIQDDLKRLTKKPSDYANRNQKEVDSWIRLIAIVTGDTAMQESSPFCACSKSTRSIPTLSLSTGV
jgi:hypothetical protein